MKTIGILGGMGPLATADLFYEIILHTEADKDQEHVPVLIDSNSQIPDRTRAILADGPSPLGELLRSAERLERAGADFIIIACNTVHYFYNQVSAAVNIPVLHMPRIAAEETVRLGYKAVAILATEGTLHSKIYEEAFENNDVRLIVPNKEETAVIMDIIYNGIKRGQREYDTAAINKVLENLRERGAEAFILGCTELPLAFSRYQLRGKTINPTHLLALKAITTAGGKLKLT